MSGSESGNPNQRHLKEGKRRASVRYFFDVDDGETFHRDNIGMELASPDHIASEVYGVLKQIVYDQWPEGQRTMTAKVRDDSGKVVYEGTMTVDGRRFPS